MTAVSNAGIHSSLRMSRQTCPPCEAILGWGGMGVIVQRGGSNGYVGGWVRVKVKVPPW